MNRQWNQPSFQKIPVALATTLLNSPWVEVFHWGTSDLSTLKAVVFSDSNGVEQQYSSSILHVSGRSVETDERG